MVVTKEKILKKSNDFKDLVKFRAKKAPSLSKVQKILNKLPVSLTKIVLEERNNY